MTIFTWKLLTFVAKLLSDTKFGSLYIGLLGQNRCPARYGTMRKFWKGKMWIIHFEKYVFELQITYCMAPSAKMAQAVQKFAFLRPPYWPKWNFYGVIQTAKGSPRPILGWYQVRRKSLEPFLRASKLTKIGQTFHISPCRDKYTFAHLVSTKTKFAFSINFFRSL